jgi:hypothetical protein
MQPNTFVDTSVLLFTTAHVPTVRNIITGHITFHAKNYSLDTTYQSYVYLVFDPLVEDTILSVWQNTPAPYHLRSYYSLLAGKVTIELALEENAVVSMIVSDILGKTVAIPVNGPVWAGLTTYDLDLPSGVYFVRTEISGNVRTEKIVVP